MSDRWDWLSRANHHHNDPQWLSEYIEELYSELRAGIHRSPDLHRAIDTLLLIYPYLLTRHDLSRWLELLDDALNEVAQLHDDQIQMQLWEQIGLSYNRLGQPKSAQVAFKATLVRAQEQDEKVMMLRAYTGLLKIQIYYHASNFDNDLVNTALELCQQVESNELRSALYQALAFTYVYRWETKAARRYAQFAYKGWRNVGHEQEMARTCYIMAVAYRIDKDYKQADRYLRRAGKLFAKTGDRKQHAIIAYEQGVLYLGIQWYQAAIQWLTMAMDELAQLQSADYQARYMAIVYHSLALAYVGLGQHEEAEKYGELSLKIWQKLDNKYEQANILNTVGYVQGRLGKKVEAALLLDQALQLCQEVPDNPQQREVLARIRESISELQ